MTNKRLTRAWVRQAPVGRATASIRVADGHRAESLASLFMSEAEAQASFRQDTAHGRLGHEVPYQRPPRVDGEASDLTRSSTIAAWFDTVVTECSAISRCPLSHGSPSRGMNLVGLCRRNCL
jgi:hypothetical protein